jgi:hypothetical protein
MPAARGASPRSAGRAQQPGHAWQGEAGRLRRKHHVPSRSQPVRGVTTTMYGWNNHRLAKSRMPYCNLGQVALVKRNQPGVPVLFW